MSTAERALYRVGRRRHRKYGLGVPDAPTDSEKTGYADRNLTQIIHTSLASFGALLISQVRFVFLSPALTWFFLPFVAFTIAYYVISLCVNVRTRGFDEAAHRELVASWSPFFYPSLDVFLPVCGEPLAVLYNTWVHVSELIQAYPGTSTAYVLDDGTDERVRMMAEDFGFRWMARADRGWMKKAGNLRHGFDRSSGEFILILDADFACRADLPAEMLPYFDADHSLGIVQSPQYFRTREYMSWTERGAGAVQELFYRLVQVSRDQHDGAICVGSCAIYRREALATNGGTTLIEHSEDVHTGFDLRRAGWGLRYIPVPLAACVPVRPGLLPQSAVPVVHRIDVVARIQEVLDYANALANSMLLPVRVLLLRAYRAIHVRRSGDPPRDAHSYTGSSSADQLSVHCTVNDLHPGRLSCLAPLPVRARGVHDQTVVWVGALVRPLGYLPP